MQAKICPSFVEESSELNHKKHSFLGAKILSNDLYCFYGVGFITSQVKLDRDARECRFVTPEKNQVGIRNRPDCLGSAEECRVICR